MFAHAHRPRVIKCNLHALTAKRFYTVKCQKQMLLFTNLDIESCKDKSLEKTQIQSETEVSYIHTNPLIYDGEYCKSENPRNQTSVLLGPNLSSRYRLLGDVNITTNGEGCSRITSTSCCEEF